MDVADTKPIDKCCSRCGIIKNVDAFIPKRNICKQCRNERSREKYKTLSFNDEMEKECNICNKMLMTSLFIKNRNICVDCNNIVRRTKYQNDEEWRKKIIQHSTEFKQKKIIEKNIKKIEELGIDNKKCNYCNVIQHKINFRYNRLKCKDCERDEPISKIIINVRSRIHSAMKNKTKHTIEYLGCNCKSYLQWLLSNDNNYTYENHGESWHIDHVIPVSNFDLLNEDEQLLAFNWRNTMPLSCSENLSKNNKIIQPQVKKHFEHLKEYHSKHNLDFPQLFIDLFAKHLDAGSPLEPC